MISQAKLNFIGLLAFTQGVIAERMGLVGGLERVISDKDLQNIRQSFKVLEAIEEFALGAYYSNIK